jgi:hypothetical protein
VSFLGFEATVADSHHATFVVFLLCDGGLTLARCL